MASLTKVYDNQKLLGQVYTPRFVVEKILADIGFNLPSSIGKTILDPSCGDGRFLVVVAEKIIQASPRADLQYHLEKIHGWDIDAQAVEACIKNLEALVRPLGVHVTWNIQVVDSLRKIQDKTVLPFDFIVGNPPYIRIQHLAEQDRVFIQQYYQFCKSGSTDTYIAFYELCDAILAPDGVCGLVTPNTFLYSETARLMRVYFATQQTLRQLTNYGNLQLFDNATTYSAITIFGKQSSATFVYEQARTTNEFDSRTIDFQEIQHQKLWQLSMRPVMLQEGVKLGAICKIHVGITTLCDKAYIMSVQPIADEPAYVLATTQLCGTVKLEKELLKPIIKASKLKTSTDVISQYVLFPYHKVNNKHKIIPEAQLKTHFPLSYNYLLRVKGELDKRDNGKPNAVAWYAFGRSQGLDTSFGKKILFSPMNNHPNFVLVEREDTTFYSGYCIKYDGDYEYLLNQLNSQRLADFIAVSSRDFRGGWKAYNKKVLEDFTVSCPPSTTPTTLW